MNNEVLEMMDALDDGIDELSAAIANRLQLEEFRKSLKAILMKEAASSGVKALAAQEREAYANPRYINHLTALEFAVVEERRLWFKRDTLKIKLDIWRTREANKRHLQGMV